MTTVKTALPQNIEKSGDLGVRDWVPGMFFENGEKFMNYQVSAYLTPFILTA